MRWADLDTLGHVNNVVYVDYLQEARVDMLRVHGRGPEAMGEALVVARHEVTYLKPLTFDGRPVSIECWVTDIKAASFTMAYEIFRDLPGGEGVREVYVRANTVLTPFVFTEERPRRITPEERAVLETHLEPDAAPRRRTPALREAVEHYPVQVRFSDVDVYRHVNNVKYFEYLQEARILMLTQLAAEGEPFELVVAQTDVDYLQPLLFRPAPYDVASAVTHVGSRSMSIESEIRDGDRVLARARVVTVFYDLAHGRSAEPPAALRERLLARVPALD
jgi:acyl-CoA thioester hydrolase